MRSMRGGFILLGPTVSKVLLRHVASTRYGDQTLSAGEHLAPGFKSLTLAPCACCVNLYVCMYTVIILVVFVTVSLCQYFLVFSVFDL
jgi:hypothetical protein